MTIPARLMQKTGADILAIHRLDPTVYAIVGRDSGARKEAGVSYAPVGARVGMVIGTAWPDCIGGGEIVWRALGQHLQTAGFEVHVFAWNRATYGMGTQKPVAEPVQKSVDGMHYHYIPERLLNPYIRTWSAKEHPVALWSTYGWDKGTNLRVSTLSGIAPLFVFQQFWQGVDTDNFSIPDTSMVVEGWQELFDIPDALIANSRFAADRWSVVTGRDDVEIITPPTEDAVGRTTADGPVIMVGNGYEKGVDLFQRVADHFPEERFVIIGNTPERHAANCESIGWADPRDYYRDAKALLAPSFVCETYGMAVEEARKWGVPTIVSDNGALRDHAEIILSTTNVMDWVGATRDALTGCIQVRGDTLSKRAALRQFDGVVRRLGRRKEADMDRKFPSIATCSAVTHTSIGYLNRAMISECGLSDYPGGDVPPHIKHVLLHSWADGQSGIFAGLLKKGVHPYVVLHSPAAQGELDKEDSVFEECLQLGTSHVLIGHAPMAKALGCRWLPVPIRLEPLAEQRRGPQQVGDTIRVGMWNTWSRRKNTWTQMLACRELARISGKQVELHGPVKPDGLNTTLAGSVLLLETQYAPQRDYYEQMGSMDLNLQVTHAESYNYTAMESYLLGAPCLVGPCTPAGRFGMEPAFVVDDPTDPILIAQMAWKAIQDAEREWFHESMIAGALELVDYRHRALQDTLEAIERGDV